MSEGMAGLQRKIGSAADLQSVVRTMKALAASSIGQYEQSLRALADYSRTVELGLGACFRQHPPAAENGKVHSAAPGVRGVIVFGSDQGLVGQFNDVVADHALQALAALPGPLEVWVVGERVHARLVDAGLAPQGLFGVPSSVKAIAPLVGQIQLAMEGRRSLDSYASVHVFHNRPDARGLYAPVGQRLLPLDAQWQQGLASVPWPAKNLPQVLHGALTLRALIREYLFISLFRACAESLSSENASRLAAMERADQNIDELLEALQANFHRLRQSAIDEELFDVIASYELLGQQAAPRPAP